MGVNELLEKHKLITTDSSLKEPDLFSVVLHNDHFTTMDFVVDILVDIFAKDSFEADTLMRKVHESGRAPVGIYPLDIARTKVQTVHDKAKEAGFPLKCTWEKI